MDYYSSLNASSLDPDTPTLFELLSAHQLQDLISPSIRYILSFYAQRHPQYLLRLANKYDELYLVLMGLVEYYHLKNWNSSFTEKFYGLKRTRVLNVPGKRTSAHAPQLFESQRRLSKRQVLLSLLFAVGLPYIKEKLDARYDVLKGRYMFRDIESDREAAYEPGKLAPRVQYEIDRFILKVYPAVNMGQSLVTLAFYLGFLFSKTSYTSPIDWIIKFKFSRMNQYDYALNDPAPIDKEDQTPLLQRLARMSTRQGAGELKKALLSGLSYALPTSMFLLKFLEWWYSSDFAQMSRKMPRGPSGDEELPVPKTAVKKVDVPEAVKKGLCPLCHGEITNPTVIETGIVFCYPCIYRYLESKDQKSGGRCPVTGQRLLGCRYLSDKDEWEIDGLRRLML
ncbi:peroxisome assembly protein 12 [Trichomonascus vanleenenianus]|uniref:ubiquitin-protein ligase peroxin 12 n=1 Tax=Trichomonascus vanleenenianus TaxID=2268995 RepID=UPI003ECB0E91